MSHFVITGGKPLTGTITVGTAKNSAVSLLSAALMIQGIVELLDVPLIAEVERFLEMLRSIGVSADWQGEHTLVLDTSGPLQMEQVDREAASEVRASLLFLGALASREKNYRLYRSGGCDLGERTVRPHLYALNKLGVHVSVHDDCYDVENRDLSGADIVMYESGDTPTENAILAAVQAPGETSIRFASANYMVQDLCHFLVAAGAKIEGIGTTTLTIRGVKKLRRHVSYAVSPDPIEAMAFISLAITTHSHLTIAGAPIAFLELELEKLSVMGQKYAIHHPRKSNSGHFDLVDIEILPSELTALPDKLYGRPYPGLNIDNVPLFVPIFTQAVGRSLIHDWVYENRAIYYLELQKLGGVVTLLDPHRIFVEGPSHLQGAEITAPNAIRPTMAILIAMLAASGTSHLHNAYPIERAHENLASRLQAIGADIHFVA